MTAEDQCFYDLLGVHRESSAEDIKKSYYALAKKLHPDKNQSDEAKEKFKTITAAYDVLKDDDKRKDYDIDRKIEVWERKKNERKKEREEASTFPNKTTTFSFTKDGNKFSFKSSYTRFYDPTDFYADGAEDLKKENVNKHRARARRNAQKYSKKSEPTNKQSKTFDFQRPDWSQDNEDTEDKENISFSFRFQDAFKEHDDMVKDFFKETIFHKAFPSGARNKFFFSFNKDPEEKPRVRSRTSEDNMWDFTKPLFGNKKTSVDTSEGDEIQLTCRKCGHKFPAGAVTSHEKRCIEYWGSTQPGPGKSRKESPDSKWRQEHEEMVERVRARQDARTQRTFPMAEDIEEEEPAEQPSSVRVSCRYCGRRFSASSAQRHVPFCHERTNRSSPAPAPRRTVTDEGSKTQRAREYAKTIPKPRMPSQSSFPTMEDFGSDEENDFGPPPRARSTSTPRRTSSVSSSTFPDLSSSTSRGSSVNGTTFTSYGRTTADTAYPYGRKWYSKPSGDEWKNNYQASSGRYLSAAQYSSPTTSRRPPASGYSTTGNYPAWASPTSTRRNQYSEPSYMSSPRTARRLNASTTLPSSFRWGTNDTNYTTTFRSPGGGYGSTYGRL